MILEKGSIVKHRESGKTYQIKDFPKAKTGGGTWSEAVYYVCEESGDTYTRLRDDFSNKFEPIWHPNSEDLVKVFRAANELLKLKSYAEQFDISFMQFVALWNNIEQKAKKDAK